MKARFSSFYNLMALNSCNGDWSFLVFSGIQPSSKISNSPFEIDEQQIDAVFHSGRSVAIDGFNVTYLSQSNCGIRITLLV